MFKLSFITFFCCMLLACGGDSSSTNNTLPTDNSNNNNSWSPKKPVYSGERETYIISYSNISETMINIAESLDLLNMLAFGDAYSQFYFLSENSNSIMGDDVSCIGGTVTSKEVEQNKKFEVFYNKCLIDGTEVNGTLRVIINGSKVIVIPNITMLDTSTNEYATINGYFELPNDHTALFYLIMEVDGEQLWFDEVKLNVYEYEYDWGIKYEGDIYISDSGKLTVSTSNIGNKDPSSPNKLTLSISANIEIELVAQLQEYLTFTYSDEYIAVTIPLTGNFDGYSDDQINQAPQAIIFPELLEIDRNLPLNLTAITSTDPDFDPLTAQWELLSGPDGSQWQVNSDHSVTFSADVPGVYSIKLTVHDLEGEASSVEESIKVLKNAPKPSISYVQVDNYIGRDFNAHIALDNDELDGPFEYKLKYGPSNMVVDDNGHLTWDGAIPNFGYDMDVNFAVYIKNSDNFTIIKNSISLKPQTVPTLTSITDSTWRSFNFSSFFDSAIIQSTQNISTLYQGGEVLSKLALDGTKLEVQHVSLYTNQKNTQYQGIYDANDDGVDDFWFSSVTRNSDNITTSHIFWKDGLTAEEHEFLSMDNSGRYLKFRLIDYDNDNQKDIIFSQTAYGEDTKVIDIKSKVIKKTIDRFSFDYTRACDFNGDGYTDFAYTNRVLDYNNDETLYYVNISASILTIDSNADGICEVIDYNGAQVTWHSLLGDNSSMTLLEGYDVLSDQVVGKFYDDGFEELVVSYRDSSENFATKTLIIKIDDLQTVAVETISREKPTSFQSPLNLVAVLDVDGDGIDEIIRKEAVTGSEFTQQRFFATKLSEGTFKEVFNSNTLKSNIYKFVDWTNTGELFYFGTYSERYIASVKESFEPQILLKDQNIRSVSIENSELFSYLWSGSKSLSKIDLAYSEYWNSNVTTDNSFNFINFGEFLLSLGSSSNDNLINASTGEIIYEVPSVDNNKYSKYDISPHSGLPKYIASGRSKSLLKIKPDLSVEVLYDSISGELMNEAEDYSFVQYDNDEQMELIIYNHIHLGREYKILDTVTLQLEPIDSLHNTIINNENITDDEIVPCFKWDKECRNLIYLNTSSLEGNTNTGTNRSLKVVDKYTGTIIWQSPELMADDIAFRKVGNKIEVAISVEGGFIYTLN